MKHAYLILAHHRFDLLQALVKELDEADNGIFIHFDRKVKSLPVVRTERAVLHLVTQRIDVRWGDISVVEAEYALFEAAFQKGQYDYFHLLSGVDFPVKSQTYIRHFFADNAGKEFIGFYQDTEAAQIDRKMQRYHLFPKHFRNNGSPVNWFRKIIRAIALRAQLVFGIRRNQHTPFRKGTQWVSVTRSFVAYLLSKREEVFRMYHHTYCPDEVYKQTLCWNSTFRERVYDLEDEGRGSLRAIGWRDGELYDWQDEDYTLLVQSESLFARKFNEASVHLIKKLRDHNQQRTSN